MIFISAGHHEHAQGAKYDGVTEYSLTTVWADKIADLLNGRANRVPNGTLKTKVTYINQNAKRGDLAIEIHFNSAKMWRDQNANGVIDDDEMIHVGIGSETLYYPGSKKGQAAAETIQDALSRIYPPNRGAKKGWYQMNPEKGPDFFLSRTRCIALIIEPEFIDNLNAINNNRESACYCIAESLIEIINNQEKDQ